MDTVGVREFRANLATLLHRAARGDRIVVTVDGEPIAQVGPIQTAGAPTLDDLVATGLVDAPRRPDHRADPDPLDAAVDIRLDDVLADLRGG